MSKKCVDIFNLDCRIGVKNIEDNYISLILTDPPYFLDGMGSEWNSEKLKSRMKGGVVGSLPAGMKFDVRQGRDLQEFLEPLSEQWLRVLKPGGFCLVFSQNRLIHRTAIALENSGFEIRDILIWKYEGQPKAFTQDHFIKKKKITEEEKKRLIDKLGGRKTPQLKPQGEMIVLAQSPKEGTFVDNWDKWETGLIDVQNPVINPGHFPGTVIPVKKTKEKFNHLTPKPVDLLRHLIRIFSAPNSIVFDPFSGSGSTGIAAIRENRSFIGYEIEEEMHNIAMSRLIQEQSNLFNLFD